MEKRIIYINNEGDLGILIPSPNAVIEEIGMEEYIENYTVEIDGELVPSTKTSWREVKTQRILTIDEIAQKDLPAGTEYKIINASELPQDRFYRDAWVYASDKVVVDLPKARNVHLNKIRARRNEKFIELGFPVKLDSSLEKAIIPEETRAILQALRDIPQVLDLSEVNTLEELTALWPEQLKGE